MTSCLVLPPSVTTARGERPGAIRDMIRAICPTGVPRKTKSASRTARPASAAISSMIPLRSASARLRRVRPTPTTCLTARAFLSASANEPPMSPTPMTTSFSIFDFAGMGARSTGERALQTVEKTRVFGFEPDRHPQMIGHAVTRNRPHDDAVPQQSLVYAGRFLDAEAHKVPIRGDVFEPQ